MTTSHLLLLAAAIACLIQGKDIITVNVIRWTTCMHCIIGKSNVLGSESHACSYSCKSEHSWEAIWAILYFFRQNLIFGVLCTAHSSSSFQLRLVPHALPGLPGLSRLPGLPGLPRGSLLQWQWQSNGVLRDRATIGHNKDDGWRRDDTCDDSGSVQLCW